MATSITYKGSELASFSNNTKTLKTAGKYLEGDITVSSTTVLGTTTVVPSETTQTISPASGQEGLSSVTVNGITNTYVGSGITTNPTITVSGPSVTIPAGYYSSQQTKTIANGTVGLGIEATVESSPSITVNANGLITAINNSSDEVLIVVDPGYISGNVTGGVGIAGEATYQLSTQGATTVTPSRSTQTINVTGKYMTGNVTVNPIPSSYVIPTGTITITTNGAHNVSSYASANVNVQPNLTTTAVTATSTTQTITPPSGYVGFSTVTVNAITLVTYYTGITTPASNFGNNGDIYLVTD